jgi:hypothetical protein
LSSFAGIFHKDAFQDYAGRVSKQVLDLKKFRQHPARGILLALTFCCGVLAVLSAIF